MRVIPRLQRGEEGAVAILTALSLFVLFGSAMIAVDAGSLWATRRSLITDTDAAVLAAAAYFDANPSHACDPGGVNEGEKRAVELLSANGPDTTLLDFTVDPVDCEHGAGKVSVTARAPATLFFAPVFNFESASAAATSIAEYGPNSAVGGLRPITICVHDPHYQEFKSGTDDPTLVGEHPNTLGLRYPGATTTVHRIFFEKRHDDPCGNAPGNWGWIDFNNTKEPNGNAALKDWIVGGYEREVATDDCNPEASGAQWCDSQTGAGGSSLDESFSKVRCPPDVPTDDCNAVPIVIYTESVCSGGGTNCRYDHQAFLSVVVRGWGQLTGNEKSKPACQTSPDPKTCPYVDFEFVDVLEQGSVGGVPPSLTTAHGIELCGGGYGGVLDDLCTY